MSMNPEHDGMDPNEVERKRFGQYEDLFGGMFPNKAKHPNRKVGLGDLYKRFNPEEPGKDGA